MKKHVTVLILTLLIISGCATRNLPTVTIRVNTENQIIRENERIEDTVSQSRILRQFIPEIQGSRKEYMGKLRKALYSLNSVYISISPIKGNVLSIHVSNQIFEEKGLSLPGYECIYRMSKVLKKYERTLIFITPEKGEETSKINSRAKIVEETLKHKGIYPLRIETLGRNTYDPTVSSLGKNLALTITLIPMGGK